ncbi:hypothetical protein AURDEDRAFT_174550 [Auricularia subglabra TFB-10046 SS5]|uniref:Uncharacterized protein n=1 Tax=Auricularia subglabra (strain TFB-10046 / SS5) TaxID=717982 RepID=J0CYH4_AURST|nr:hypothetical protein AURDEDRAFT_174550 [Auricularia subglabra TFB-10046 SS5]
MRRSARDASRLVSCSKRSLPTAALPTAAPAVLAPVNAADVVLGLPADWRKAIMRPALREAMSYEGLRPGYVCVCARGGELGELPVLRPSDDCKTSAKLDVKVDDLALFNKSVDRARAA